MAEPSPRPVRAHPVAGQGLPAGMHVECCTKMREGERVGSILKIRAKMKYQKGVCHLYSRYGWDYEVLTTSKARDYLRVHGEEIQEWALENLP